MKLSRAKIARLLKQGKKQSRKYRSQSLNMQMQNMGMQDKDLILLNKQSQTLGLKKYSHGKRQQTNLRLKTLKNKRNENQIKVLQKGGASIDIKVNYSYLVVVPISVAGMISTTTYDASSNTMDISMNDTTSIYNQIKALHTVSTSPQYIDDYILCNGVKIIDKKTTLSDIQKLLKKNDEGKLELNISFHDKTYIFLHRLLYGDLYYLIDVGSIRRVLSFLLAHPTAYSQLYQVFEEDEVMKDNAGELEMPGEEDENVSGAVGGKSKAIVPAATKMAALKGGAGGIQAPFAKWNPDDTDYTSSNDKEAKYKKFYYFLRGTNENGITSLAETEVVPVNISGRLFNKSIYKPRLLFKEIIEKMKPDDASEPKALTAETIIDIRVGFRDACKYYLPVSLTGSLSRFETMNMLQKINYFYKRITAEDFVTSQNKSILTKFTINVFKSAPSFSPSDEAKLKEFQGALNYFTNAFIAYRKRIANTKTMPEGAFYGVMKFINPAWSIIRDSTGEDIMRLEYELRRGTDTGATTRLGAEASGTSVVDKDKQLWQAYRDDNGTSIRRMLKKAKTTKVGSFGSSWGNFLNTAGVLDSISEVVAHTTLEIIPSFAMPALKAQKAKVEAKKNELAEKQKNALKEAVNGVINEKVKAGEDIVAAANKIVEYTEANKGPAKEISGGGDYDAEISTEVTNIEAAIKIIKDDVKPPPVPPRAAPPAVLGPAAKPLVPAAADPLRPGGVTYESDSTRGTSIPLYDSAGLPPLGPGEYDFGAENDPLYEEPVVRPGTREYIDVALGGGGKDDVDKKKEETGKKFKDDLPMKVALTNIDLALKEFKDQQKLITTPSAPAPATPAPAPSAEEAELARAKKEEQTIIENIEAAIKTKKDTEADAKLAAFKAKIGNESSGLIADIVAKKGAIKTAEKDLPGLKTTEENTKLDAEIDKETKIITDLKAAAAAPAAPAADDSNMELKAAEKRLADLELKKSTTTSVTAVQTKEAEITKLKTELAALEKEKDEAETALAKFADDPAKQTALRTAQEAVEKAQADLDKAPSPAKAAQKLLTKAEALLAAINVVAGAIKPPEDKKAAAAAADALKTVAALAPGGISGFDKALIEQLKQRVDALEQKEKEEKNKKLRDDKSAGITAIMDNPDTLGQGFHFDVKIPNDQLFNFRGPIGTNVENSLKGFMMDVVKGSLGNVQKDIKAVYNNEWTLIHKLYTDTHNLKEKHNAYNLLTTPDKKVPAGNELKDLLATVKNQLNTIKDKMAGYAKQIKELKDNDLAAKAKISTSNGAKPPVPVKGGGYMQSGGAVDASNVLVITNAVAVLTGNPAFTSSDKPTQTIIDKIKGLTDQTTIDTYEKGGTLKNDMTKLKTAFTDSKILDQLKLIEKAFAPAAPSSTAPAPSGTAPAPPPAAVTIDPSNATAIFNAVKLLWTNPTYTADKVKFDKITAVIPATADAKAIEKIEIAKIKPLSSEIDTLQTDAKISPDAALVKMLEAIKAAIDAAVAAAPAAPAPPGPATPSATPSAAPTAPPAPAPSDLASSVSENATTSDEVSEKLMKQYEKDVVDYAGKVVALVENTTKTITGGGKMRGGGGPGATGEGATGVTPAVEPVTPAVEPVTPAVEPVTPAVEPVTGVKPGEKEGTAVVVVAAKKKEGEEEEVTVENKGEEDLNALEKAAGNAEVNAANAIGLNPSDTPTTDPATTTPLANTLPANTPADPPKPDPNTDTPNPNPNPTTPPPPQGGFKKVSRNTLSKKMNKMGGKGTSRGKGTRGKGTRGKGTRRGKGTSKSKGTNKKHTRRFPK